MKQQVLPHRARVIAGLDKAEQVGVYFVAETNKRFVQRKCYWNKREQQALIE